MAATIACLAGCGRSAQSYLERGNALFDQGKYNEAELNYRKAIQKDSKLGEAYHRLGMAALKQNDLTQGYQALVVAEQMMPDNQAVKVDLANFALKAYLADQRRPKALYDLLLKLSDELLKRDPNSLDGLKIKGSLALTDRHLDQAEQLFRHANQVKPGQPDLVVGLMETLFEQKRTAEAEKLGLDFIGANKNAGAVYEALIGLYNSTNRPAEAEKTLIRKAQDNPNQSAYALQLAAYYARAKNPSQMAAALQPLFANPSAFPRAYADAGDLYLSIGDRARALELFEAGAKAHPKDASLYQDREARVLLLENKRDEAARVLDGVIKANPENTEAQTLRAVAMVVTPGAADEGTAQLQAMVEKTPDDVSLRYLFAKTLFLRGNTVAAKPQLLEVIKKSPGLLEARIDLAELAMRQGQFSEGLQSAEGVLQIDPANSQAQFIKGSALLGLGRLNESYAAFFNLSRQNPKSVNVMLQIAVLETRRNRFPEAEAGYRRILESSPNEWRAVAGLVDNYSAQHRLDKAFPLLEQELQKSHGAAPVRVILAETALKDRRYDLAIEQYRQLAAQAPTASLPQIGLAEAMRLKGDTAAAIDVLRKASAAQPRDPQLVVLLATDLQGLNRNREAIEQWRRALSLRPDDPGLMNNLAFLLADTGDSLDEALKLARQASAKTPNEPAFSDTLGWVLVKKGMNDQAIDILRKLATSYADNSMYAYHLGVAFYQKGEKASAKIQLVHALAMGPSPDLATRINDTLGRLN